MTNRASFTKFKLVITKCDKKVLQSVTGIKKWDKRIKKCDNYYNVRCNTSVISNRSMILITERDKLNHCLKSVRIRSFSDPFFPASGLNKKRFGASLRIQAECGKIRTRKTPNTDIFHAVNLKVKRKRSSFFFFLRLPFSFWTMSLVYKYRLFYYS